jgi:hypothetical protein
LAYNENSGGRKPCKVLLLELSSKRKFLTKWEILGETKGKTPTITSVALPLALVGQSFKEIGHGEVNRDLKTFVILLQEIMTHGEKLT